jgi:hypothetical protein
MKAAKIILFFSVVAAASATSLTAIFNFNTVAESTGTAAQAQTAIQNYMNGVLTAAGCSTCTVTVTGAFADTNYNADGHVTGPGTSGGTASKSLTLGTSDNAGASNLTSSVNSSYDTFLATTNDAASLSDTQITMTFNGFTLNGTSNASFDYEIFPNLTCTALTNSGCGGAPTGGIYPNQPDFVFDINGSTVVSSFGTGGTLYGVAPGSTNGNSNDSPLTTTELAPQYIGTWAGSLNGATSLDFIDWPATIGVDNLVISFTPNTQSAVPEPMSVLLLGTVIGGLALRKKLLRKSV